MTADLRVAIGYPAGIPFQPLGINVDGVGTTPLSVELGALAGMDFDPATDTFYVADGGSGGTDSLYTLDPATGVLDPLVGGGTRDIIASAIIVLTLMLRPHGLYGREHIERV